MKKVILTLTVAGIMALSSAFNAPTTKLVTKTGHIIFFSNTSIEDISANNYKVISTLDMDTGEIVYSVPMQAFEFEKSLMQQHFNSSKFLDTKTYPKSKFKGQISNLKDINFEKDGTYNVSVVGEMTIHGVTKAHSEKATITVKENKVTVDTKMKITLADHNISFKKGKPSTNIAKTIDVTSKSVYTRGSL